MDGVLVIGGCDKNMPGGMMGMLRANVPAIYVYGGTILPGHYKGQDLNIVSVFEAVGQFSRRQDERRRLLPDRARAIPGSGSCGGMYTANTMSSAFEALGMSLPYSSTMANVEDPKVGTPKSGPRAGRGGEGHLKPRDIVTRKSIENAVAVIMATGGSTNAVLHFLAIAHAPAWNGPSTTSSACASARRCCATSSPAASTWPSTCTAPAAFPQVMKVLLNAGLLHGDCITITGQTMAENLADVPDRCAPTRT
jgi:dihydroxy-acid dehydratase